MSDPTELHRAIGDEMIRHAKLLQVARQHMAGTLPPGVDAASIALLMRLVHSGPLRQRELAEHALVDPSTASRQVAQLVATGLVERRRDPADGRAVLLAATAEGLSLGERISQRRHTVVRAVLDGWADEDLSALLTLVRRLNGALEQLRHDVHPPKELSA